MLFKIIGLSILYLAVGHIFALKIIDDYEWDPKTRLKRFLLLEAVAIFGPPICAVLIAIILVYTLFALPYNTIEDTDS
ncbi:MAG: hypothetical protein NTX00_01955 [Candidatus Parcubacteria bacterium]|nr:hypothetical protein [Candidatus Parcubacteria bacterium]